MASMTSSKQMKGVPIQELEISPETLAFTHGKDAKNIKIKQYLCVRDVIPKTNLYHTILLENRSQDRHLERTLSNLSLRQLKNANSLDLTARTFMAMQERKQKKWKREDEMRLSSMNLPSLQVTDNRPKSVDVMYHMPEYTARQKSKREKSREKSREKPKEKDQTFPKMPYSVRREQTEIVTHKERAYMTRLPEMVEVDQDALKHYDMYRGKKYLSVGATKTDDRFKNLTGMLKPAMLKNLDSYPLENATCKSRLSKYSNSMSDPDEEMPSRKPTSNWMLTQSDTGSELANLQFTQGAKPRREVSFEDTSQRLKRSDEILRSFRTMDVKKLAKSVLKERKEKVEDNEQEDENETGKKVFVPGVNVYYSKSKKS